MNTGGSAIIIVIALVVLAAVLYSRTACFGGFFNCLTGAGGSTAPAITPPVAPTQTSLTLPTVTIA